MGIKDVFRENVVSIPSRGSELFRSVSHRMKRFMRSLDGLLLTTSRVSYLACL